MSQKRGWKATYRCINNCIEEPITPFASDIARPINIKLSFGHHRFDVYFRFEETEKTYVCRTRIRPHIYERCWVVRTHIDPYIYDETHSILDALATSQQYLPSRLARANGLPLTGEYGPAQSYTPRSPPDFTSRLGVAKGAARPWPDTANAFLYAVTLLDAAMEGTVVDRFAKRPRLATARHR